MKTFWVKVVLRRLILREIKRNPTKALAMMLAWNNMLNSI
jgi:hypothetical protein